MFKVNNKPTKTTPMFLWRRFIGFILIFEYISHLCSGVSIVNFEHVIASWDIRLYIIIAVFNCYLEGDNIKSLKF